MEGGYEGVEAFGRRYFGILGVREHLESRDCIFCLGYFSGLEFGWTVAGVHRLLGVLGSGAKNPHRILELGSHIGSVHS
jgi:hypothetical protein